MLLESRERYEFPPDDLDQEVLRGTLKPLILLGLARMLLTLCVRCPGNGRLFPFVNVETKG